MPILTNSASRFLGGSRSFASWKVVTTGAATHTIAAFTVSAATVVDWGDGSTDTYTGAGARTHNYAGAGTWTVRVMQPLNVTALTLSDNKVVLNSSEIASMTNMVTFEATGVKRGTFNSADVAVWRLTTFKFYNMPAGYIGTFSSSDVSAWRPTIFWLFNMPAGYIGTFSSSDVSAWNPTAGFYLYLMPAGYEITFASADVSAWRPAQLVMRNNAATFSLTLNGGFANWTTTTIFWIQGNAFSQAQVNAILYELYQASIAPRTGSGGQIVIDGSNAAPSGTFQACASPPVTAATPGKEIAHELLNDTIGAFANHWATVTTS